MLTVPPVGLALYVAISSCGGVFHSDVVDVEATVEHCGAGGLSPTVVRLENPNDVPVTTVVEIAVYDDSTGEKVLASSLLKSVPAQRTLEAEQNIMLGLRPFISCKVVGVTTRPTLPGID